MSPLAKLLQIRPSLVEEREGRQPLAAKLWKRVIEAIRSTRAQRRIRRMEVMERVTLGNKQSIVLVRVDERQFVVGC